MVHVPNCKNKTKNFYWPLIFNESMHESLKGHCLKTSVVKITLFHGTKHSAGHRHMKNFIPFSFR